MSNECAAIVLESDRPGLLNAAQGLADRPTADTEPERHLGLADASAGGQFAGWDQLFDRLLGCGGQ